LQPHPGLPTINHANNDLDNVKEEFAGNNNADASSDNDNSVEDNLPAASILKTL